VSVCDSGPHYEFHLNQTTSAILNFRNFDFYTHDPPQNRNTHLHIKFHWNQIIKCWDTEITTIFKIATTSSVSKCYVTCACQWFWFLAPNFAIIGKSSAEFSIWRPTVILNFQNFDFYSRPTSLGQIHSCTSNFIQNWMIHGWYMDKIIFQMVAICHHEFIRCHLSHASCLNWFKKIHITDPKTAF